MDLTQKVNRNIEDIVKLVRIKEKQSDIGKSENLLILNDINVLNVEKQEVIF
jgi:hypothetical protein